MPRVSGVVFSNTREGYLDRDRLPEDGFEEHFLAAGSTKAQSSFPVVDADGYLRRGNVVQAWAQRERSKRENFERRVRALGRYFDENPLADHLDEIDADTTYMTLDVGADLEFAATRPDGGLDFNSFEDRVGVGFNDYGVRENRTEDGTLESVDVLYEAMQPGPPEDRNGVRITDEFLRALASKQYDDPPHLKDHESKDTFARIGRMKEAFFSDQTDSLWVMTRTPNIEGSPTYQEAIARYTHDPPEITDGSIGLGQNYEAVYNDNGEPELVDGKIREFSTVNFPGGYDDGGVSAAFAEAAQEAVAAVDDSGNSDENSAAFSITTETTTY